MARRLLNGLRLAGLLAAVLVAARCGDDLPARCTLQTTALAANALTLMPDARLDRAGSGFVLLGTDGGSVLWQTIDPTGTAGPLRAADVPAHSDGPWFGVAGAAAPADHVVILYAANPAGGMATLMSTTVGLDGSPGAGPAAVGTIPDKASMKAALLMSAGSGQAGRHMGVLWSVKGTSTVTAKILGGDGQPVGGDVSLGNVDDIDCPRFTIGQGDLTASFVKTSGTPATQTLVAREFNADGSPGSTVNLGLVDWSSDQAQGCVALAAASSGYGFGWRVDGKTFAGDDFALFDPAAGNSYTPYQLASDERAAGGRAAPVMGLGRTADPTTRFIVVLAEVTGGQAWEIDSGGRPRSPAVTFPSVKGNTGTFSTQAMGGSLYVSYADYTGKSASDHGTGSRVFGQVTCH